MIKLLINIIGWVGSSLLIIEDINNLSLLKNKEFTFTAVPPKIEAIGTFPIRSFATISE